MTGKRRLLDIAIRFADQLVAEFGSGRRDDYDGHPEVETALVELYRVCGDPAYLALAKQFIDNRGRRIFVGDGRGDAYFQDEQPIRDATSIVGHAVRALYLEAGVVDVAVETGDTELLQTSLTRWDDMVASKLYITGGVGSRHKSEGFGDPYELPPDRAYCETCAAIASIHWNWRLLLATGESRFADLLERTVYNGFAASTGARWHVVLLLQSLASSRRARSIGRRRIRTTAALVRVRVLPTQRHATRRGDAALRGDRPTSVAASNSTNTPTQTSSCPTANGTVGFSVRTRYPWAGTVEIQISGFNERAVGAIATRTRVGR